MEEPLKIYRHQLEEMLEEARIEGRSRKMEDRERIAELLVEPDISGMDWNLGSQILMNWKAELPDRILSELGYTRQPELTKISDEEIYRTGRFELTENEARELMKHPSSFGDPTLDEFWWRKTKKLLEKQVTKVLSLRRGRIPQVDCIGGEATEGSEGCLPRHHPQELG